MRNEDRKGGRRGLWTEVETERYDSDMRIGGFPVNLAPFPDYALTGSQVRVRMERDPLRERERGEEGEGGREGGRERDRQRQRQRQRDR